ncbi:substrate-binding domain-containing protein [Mycobacterium uberis]|uniref:substrate-binding domain-containing protein n=1 Tax=Mycobacterium uberis TaxID=2162698 RepID=UPI0014033EBD|nr:substrate-binding domain-containing protein [Mycobacterium uberis]
MGRHSMPDPEDSIDQPSNQVAAFRPGQDNEIDRSSDRGYPGEIGYPEPVSEPATTDSPSDHGYPHKAEYPADSTPQIPDQPAGYQRYCAEDHEDHYLGGQHPNRDKSSFTASAADDYSDFPPRPVSSSTRLQAPTALSRLFNASHRSGGEWQGGHRSDGGRRGVSISVIVALVAVMVVVGTVILWTFLGHILDKRKHQAAARCVGGQQTVAVIADPSIADYLKEFAHSYNAAARPVGDHCMAVTVKPVGSEAALTGLNGNWPADLGAKPALWIPGSSISAARLAVTAGQKTISESHSLVTSLVLLAVRPELEQALTDQSWAALPGLQTNPYSLADLNLPAWGSLRLSLPINGNSDATLLAGEAVAAASVPAGAPPTQGVGAVRTLMSAQPKLTDGTWVEAMSALLKPGDVATAPVHAVITTEQQLFQHGQSLPDAKSTLGSWLPQGPAPVADYPAVLLSGSWLTHEQTAAANEFARFVQKPDQLAKLAKAGFRVNGVTPPSSPITSFAAAPSTLSVGDDGMRATLAEAMIQPSSGVATTIMLDQSMPTNEGGKTRLANVVATLDATITTMPPTSVMGLWTFDGQEGRTEVTTGPLADPVNGQPRSAALMAALDKQYASNGGAVSFTTLRMVYQDMLANYHAGQMNSVLVITTGPHTDQTLDGAGLQDFIRTSTDPTKPIAVNVIDFGTDLDRATWEAVAQLSGGSYQNLSTSASPDLATAINTFLS